MCGIGKLAGAGLGKAGTGGAGATLLFFTRDATGGAGAIFGAGGGGATLLFLTRDATGGAGEIFELFFALGAAGGGGASFAAGGAGAIIGGCGGEATFAAGGAGSSSRILFSGFDIGGIFFVFCFVAHGSKSKKIIEKKYGSTTKTPDESARQRHGWGGQSTSCKVTPPVLHIYMQCMAFTCSFIMEWF